MIIDTEVHHPVVPILLTFLEDQTHDPPLREYTIRIVDIAPKD